MNGNDLDREFYSFLTLQPIEIFSCNEKIFKQLKHNLILQNSFTLAFKMSKPCMKQNIEFVSSSKVT